MRLRELSGGTCRQDGTGVEAEVRMERGIVFGIQYFSIHDGPGVRTTVFLKGCNLRCAWCHNPESLDARVEIGVAGEKCVGCGGCAAVCPAGLHHIGADGSAAHVHDPAHCTGCGACAEACPTGAIRKLGREMTVEEVLFEVLRDRRFYGGDGGMTVTGGEPMLQYDFLRALLRGASEAGVGACIETNATFPWEMYAALLPYLDSILVDYKLEPGAAHRKWTGSDGVRVADNIARFAASGKNVVLRCPIIPGVNDDNGHLRAIAELTARNPGLRGAELMPYHRLGTSKARQLDWDAERIREFPVPDAAQIDGWKRKICEFGGRLIG